MGFSSGQGSEFVNLFPYTSNVIWEKEPLLCLGMSVCYSVGDRVVEYNSKSFNYDNFSFDFPVKNNIYCFDNLCKICGNNNYIAIYSSRQIDALQVVRAKPFALIKTDLTIVSELSSVMAINIVGEKGAGLSVAFKNPARISYLSRHHIFIEYYGDCIYVSKEPVMMAIRRLFIETSMHRSNIVIGSLHYIPFMEVVDPYSVLVPQNFHDRCIEMSLYNITDNAINSIIKVYGGRVAKIQIDDVEYEYRHNVVRVAMAPTSKSRLRLCLQPKTV
ncbi:MAG: hypothetical protein QW348_00975 [Ignisphaera sp.]